jgi:hypothetical protein
MLGAISPVGRHWKSAAHGDAQQQVSCMNNNEAKLKTYLNEDLQRDSDRGPPQVADSIDRDSGPLADAAAGDPEQWGADDEEPTKPDGRICRAEGDSTDGSSSSWTRSRGHQKE